MHLSVRWRVINSGTGTSKIIKYYDTLHPIPPQNNFLNVAFVKEISTSQLNMDMHNSNYVFCQYHNNSMFGALASVYPKCVRNIWIHFYKNNPFSNIRITHGLFLSYMTQADYCPKRDEEAWVMQGERWAGEPEERNDTIPLRAGPGCNHFRFSCKAVRSSWQYCLGIDTDLKLFWSDANEDKQSNSSYHCFNHIQNHVRVFNLVEGRIREQIIENVRGKR